MRIQKVPFKPVKLDAKQRRLWDDTLAALNWIAPGMVHVIYTMLSNTGDDEVALFTEDMQFPAATDGLQLIFKPSAFFSQPLMKRVFMVLHEVMHEILNHVGMAYYYKKQGYIELNGKRLPWSMMFANVMQDFGINATLIASKWGEYDKAWLFDKDLHAETITWIELYFQQWKNPPKPKQPPQGGRGKPCDDGTPSDLPGAGKPEPGDKDDPGKDQPAIQGKGKGFDEHLEPGESQGKEAHEVPERNEAAWEIAVNTAMEIQRAQGKLPGAMEHFFQTVLKPNVDWTDHVEGELVRVTGSDTYNWQKLDRRLAVRGVGAPALSGFSCGLIVVGFDSSGSIFQDKTLLDRFRGEMAGMLEDLHPKEIRCVVCDTRVTQEVTLEEASDLRHMNVVKGGGGTRFEPVFEYVEENGLVPDAMIYLTDLAGSFPKQEPDYPVIWGSIDANGSAPFGKVVFIPTNTE